MIEAIGMIRRYNVTIIFESRAIDSFISPFVVEKCRLVVARQDVDWEVELADSHWRHDHHSRLVYYSIGFL